MQTQNRHKRHKETGEQESKRERDDKERQTSEMKTQGRPESDKTQRGIYMKKRR
jgi:hypothetical protein